MNLYLKNLSQEKQQKKAETNCEKGIYRKKLLTPNRERNEIRVSFILNKEKEKGRRKKKLFAPAPPHPPQYRTPRLSSTEQYQSKDP